MNNFSSDISKRLRVITTEDIELKLRIHKTKSKEDGKIHLFRYQWYKVTGGGTPTRETDDLALIVGVFMLGGGVRFSTKSSNTQLSGWKMKEIFIDDVEIKGNTEIQAFLRNLYQEYFPEFGKEKEFPISRPTLEEPDTNKLKEFGQKLLEKIQEIRSREEKAVSSHTVPSAETTTREADCETQTFVTPETPLEKTTTEITTEGRLGQQEFRAKLDDYWKNKCAVTGCSVREALRASHIIPWSDCDKGEKRIDRFNGLLLVANLDALFDKHLITFEKDGIIRISNKISPEDRAILGINEGMKLHRIDDKHQPYLEVHRKRFEEKQNQEG